MVLIQPLKTSVVLSAVFTHHGYDKIFPARGGSAASSGSARAEPMVRFGVSDAGYRRIGNFTEL